MIPDVIKKNWKFFWPEPYLGLSQAYMKNFFMKVVDNF